MLYLVAFFLFLGGFIFGIFLLRSGFTNLKDESLIKWMIKLSDNPWKAAILGILLTLIFQNHIAAILFTMGLVSASIINTHQSIGIVIGTMIGTMIIVEMITLNLGLLVGPFALVGAILSYVKMKQLVNIGYVLIGLSLIYGAMWGVDNVAASINEVMYVNELFVYLNEHSFITSILAACITAIFQFNTAITGITMSFLSVDAIHLETGIAVLLGTYIGISLALYITSFSYEKEARLTAFAYIWISILTMIIYFPTIELLAIIGSSTSASPDHQLAHVNSIMTIFISLFLLPLSKKLEKLLRKIHSN